MKNKPKRITTNHITQEKFEEILARRNLKLVPGKEYTLDIDDKTGELVDIIDPNETIN